MGAWSFMRLTETCKFLVIISPFHICKVGLVAPLHFGVAGRADCNLLIMFLQGARYSFVKVSLSNGCAALLEIAKIIDS